VQLPLGSGAAWPYAGAVGAAPPQERSSLFWTTARQRTPPTSTSPLRWEVWFATSVGNIQSESDSAGHPPSAVPPPSALAVVSTRLQCGLLMQSEPLKNVRSCTTPTSRGTGRCIVPVASFGIADEPESWYAVDALPPLSRPGQCCRLCREACPAPPGTAVLAARVCWRARPPPPSAVAAVPARGRPPGPTGVDRLLRCRCATVAAAPLVPRRCAILARERAMCCSRRCRCSTPAPISPARGRRRRAGRLPTLG
jgi:hypothetical protein